MSEDLVSEARKSVGLGEEEADAMSEAITNRIISSLDGIASKGAGETGPPLIYSINGSVFFHSGAAYGVGVLPNHKRTSIYRVSDTGEVKSIATFDDEAEAGDFATWLDDASERIGGE